MVVDTMIFCYALLGVTEHRERAFAVLDRAPVIEVPDLFHAEFANVLGKWVRHKGVAPSVALALLDDATALIDRVIRSDRLWERALELSVSRDHPAYDTFFIAAAESSGSKLITLDTLLCRRFPETTLTPEQFLALNG